MTTRKKTAQPKSNRIAVSVTERDPAEVFSDNYLEYGRLTLEDRALPDYRDGLLKVYRRTLWAMHGTARTQLSKTARVVGDTLGKYHPHGDLPVSNAIEVMVWMPNAPVYGEGNWGGQNDSAAAMRYCFVGSTRVVTSKGLLSFDELAKMYSLPAKFSDLEVTDLTVASLHGPESASHLLNSGVQDTVRVTASGYSTQCTPNEPFYVITPNGYRWIDAQRLQPGDVICMSRNTGMDFADAAFTNENLAVVLGYLVGDGYLNPGQKHVGFNQVDVPTFNDFMDHWRASVPFDFTTGVRAASSYGKQDYNQFYCNSVEAIKWFGNLGLLPGDSYDREIPSCIWSGTRKVMAKFLSALFESDGSVSNAGRGSSTIQLSSVSRKLIDDVSLMLRSVFGIFATEHVYAGGEIRLLINGVENLRRFEEISFRTDRRPAVVIQANGKSNFDRIPHAANLGFSRGYNFTQRETFRRKYEHGAYADSKAAQAIYERDYFYATVESVQSAGRAMVYDLTVPATSAFVADGFIVHNTNCRLSDYALEHLFHKDYMPTINTHGNYDGKDVEPELLPALLPNVILNGATGVALGLNTTIPSFKLPGVIKILKGMLAGKKLTPAAAAKNLDFVFPFGGWVPKEEYNEEAILEIMKTGKGSVYVCVDFDLRPDRIVITGVPPRMKTDSLIDNLRDSGYFTQVQDQYGNTSKTPADIHCVLKRGQKADRVMEALMEEDFVFSKVPFQIAVVERSWNEERRAITADIYQWGVVELLEHWLEWRLGLEDRMLECRVDALLREQQRKNLLLLAQENRKLIAQSWEIDDQEKFIATKLKISADDAKYVVGLRVSQLAKLDRDQLTADLKALEASIKAAKTQRKDLAGSVLARL